jgi:hypothetical protein
MRLLSASLADMDCRFVERLRRYSKCLRRHCANGQKIFWIVRVEILYFEGCPNADEAEMAASEAVRAEGLVADIVRVVVDDPESAVRLRFLGSPTVRVNGLDIEQSARAKSNFGMMCRVYECAGKRRGVPSVELARRAIQEARGAER